MEKKENRSVRTKFSHRKGALWDNEVVMTFLLWDESMVEAIL